MDLARLGELGNQGVLAMLADSTNVERQGYTPSENVVADSLDRQFRNCDQRIIVTTFASNMHRIQSILLHRPALRPQGGRLRPRAWRIC